MVVSMVNLWRLVQTTHARVMTAQSCMLKGLNNFSEGFHIFLFLKIDDPSIYSLKNVRIHGFHFCSSPWNGKTVSPILNSTLYLDSMVSQLLITVVKTFFA